jgi:hypothetical protein
MEEIMPTSDSNQNLEPVASVFPTINQLPELPASAYQEAPVVVGASYDAPPRKFGFGKLGVFALVIVVVAIIIVAVLLIDGPKFTPQLISQPVSSSPVASAPVSSAPVQNPVGNEAKSLDLALASIAKDGTIRLYDKAEKELVINLSNKNWSQLQISPGRHYISVLSKTSPDTNDTNLQLYKFDLGKWEQVTAFGNTVGGIDRYFWIDEQTVLFTQEGWLHKLVANSGQITKVTRLDAQLVSVNLESKQLIVKSIVDYTVKPAVTKKVPDPDFKPADKAPLIEIIVTPALVKHDNVFKVTDYDGKSLAGSRIEDLVELSGNFLLRNYYFTPTADKYLAEVVDFNPQTGEVGSEIKHLIVVSKEVKLPITFPAEPKIIVIGLLGDNILVNVFDKDQNSLAVGIINFERNTVFHAGYASPFATGQKITDSYVVAGNRVDESTIFIQTTEQVKGLAVVKRGWYKLDEVGRKLNTVGPKEESLEVVQYQK